MSYREVRQKVVDISTPSYSFTEIHKLIPANEALEEEGQLQEASRGTAVENEDKVAGEDVKIKRPKAEEVKENNLGVGHLSEDNVNDSGHVKDLAKAPTIQEKLDKLSEVIKDQYMDTDDEEDVELTTLGEAVGIERPRIN